MNYTIDSQTGNVIAKLKGHDTENRYNVPLARAICRTQFCETIQGKYHYFQTRSGELEVTFNVDTKAADVIKHIESRVELSQDWLSKEIGRLSALEDDYKTLRAWKEAAQQ